jgi:hypothetical protein
LSMWMKMWLLILLSYFQEKNSKQHTKSSYYLRIWHQDAVDWRYCWQSPFNGSSSKNSSKKLKEVFLQDYISNTALLRRFFSKISPIFQLESTIMPKPALDSDTCFYRIFTNSISFKFLHF